MTREPEVVTISGEELQQLAEALTTETWASARFMVDDGGLKVSVNRGSWSLPLGRVGS